MKAMDRVRWAGKKRPPRILGVLAALLLGSAAVLAQAPPAKVIVEDVIAHGNRLVPTQRVMSLVKTRPGAEYSRDVVGEDVRRLNETRSFENVQVKEQFLSPDKVVVHFEFKEHLGLIQEIVYQGAKHFKTDDLDTATGLRKGLPLNPDTNMRARQIILDKYRDKGRLWASVELLEGGQRGDSRVVFNITEGPVVRVGSIDFTGNNFVTGPRLYTQVNSSRAFLGMLGGDYNPGMADNDVAKLEEYYRSFGFHDVKVSRELSWREDLRMVDLIFHIQEGPRYRVAGVDVSGNSRTNSDELLTLVSLRQGEYYSETKSKTDQHKMKDWYGYQGTNPAVQENVFYPPDKPGELVVHYEIQERPLATVGQIIIVGNETTKQNVILRQIPLYPGQVLTYPDLRLAEKNLARLNIFESNPEHGIRPTVTVLDPDSDNPVKDILVNIQETQTGSLLFGVGVNSDAGLTGSIVLNERNFDILRPPKSFEDLLSGHAWRGAGQEFRIEAVPGTELQRYSVSFREPFLFDSPYSLGLSGYYFTRVFNEYYETRLGTRVSLGRQLNRYWSVNGAVRVENVGVSNVVSYAPTDITSVVGDNFLVGLRASVQRDSRDSFLRPTEGSLVDFSFEQVLGEFTFPVGNIEANQYFTTYERPDGSGRHVVALRSQVSIAGTNAPVYERFYAGGFRSMRGFEFRGISPDINGFKVGGKFMFLNSAEYQIPVLANDRVYLVGFVDSGTVESDVKITDYRVAAGVGARIIVPMLGPVPIALDFGFPIVKNAADREQMFSFWVGFFH